MVGRIREIFMELLETQLPIVLQQVTINLIPLFRAEATKSEFFPLLESFYFVHLDGTWNGLHGDIDSQSAFIWILGEFCNSNNFDEEKLEEIMKIFEEIAEAESFKLEGIEFQSELILAAIKIFIQNNGKYENLLRRILKRGIEEGESVDLRDRCKIYERLLNFETTKGVLYNKNDLIDKAKGIAVDDWSYSVQADTSSVYESVLMGLIDNSSDSTDGSTDSSDMPNAKPIKFL